MSTAVTLTSPTTDDGQTLQIVLPLASMLMLVLVAIMIIAIITYLRKLQHSKPAPKVEMEAIPAINKCKQVNIHRM